MSRCGQMPLFLKCPNTGNMQLACAELDDTSFTGNNGGLFFYGQIGRADARPSHGGGEPSPGHDGAHGGAPSRRFPTGRLAERTLGPPMAVANLPRARRCRRSRAVRFPTGALAERTLGPSPPARACFSTDATAAKGLAAIPNVGAHFSGTLAERTLGPPPPLRRRVSPGPASPSIPSRISRRAGKFALPCAMSPAIRRADKRICTRGAGSRRTAPVTRLPARARK